MSDIKSIKLLLWGTGLDWQIYIGRLKQLVACGDISLVGVTGNDSYYSRLDGIPFVTKADLANIDYDYVLVIPSRYYSQITQEAKQYGIDEDKILLSHILDIENFSFNKYVTLKKSRPSIISNNCWGGLTYHHLRLPFWSPFINMYLEDEDFIQLIYNLREYMQEEPSYHAQGYNSDEEFSFPIFNLGDIRLYMNHYHDADEAKAIWQKRVERINWDNLFVMMYTENVDMARTFSKTSFSKRVCFVPHRDLCFESCMLVKPYAERKDNNISFWNYVLGMARGNLPYYDVWSLLLEGSYVYRVE